MKTCASTSLSFGKILLVATCYALFSGSIAQAQVVTATLTGTVKDQSGAVIPKVTVTATNVATNISRKTTTGSAGDYEIPALAPGNYTLSAEFQGFKTAEVTGIVLQVNQTARLDLTLQPGASVQKVEVKGSAPVLNTENAEIGSVIGETTIAEIPLNGRNFMELTTLSAGIHPGGGSNPAAYANGGYAPSAAGQPGSENNYTLDGSTNTAPYFNNYNINPSVDAVQEFKIQVGQYSAEFGAGGGAVVNVITRSGTNDIHGTAFEFLRNNVLDARNFFATTIGQHQRNQFGGSLGGPIKKNKAFFFANYDGTRELYGQTFVSTVPTAAERGGDLSALGKTITDPTTGLPFSGALIPSGLINTTSAGILGYYPLPNITGTQISNYILNNRSTNNIDNLTFRQDTMVNEKNTLTARYSYENFGVYTPGPFPTVGGANNPQRSQNAIVTWTSNLSPNSVNVARMSFERWKNNDEGENTGKPIGQQLGLVWASLTPDSLDQGYPEQISLDDTIMSGTGETRPFLIHTDTFEWYDGFTWTHGTHTIKAGADVDRTRAWTRDTTHANGFYTFTGQYTGDGFSDFLLGNPEFIGALVAPSPAQHYFQTSERFYVLDEWKVTPKLTLNYGLRYEYKQPPWEEDGLAAVFDPSLGNGAGGLLYGSRNKTLPATNVASAQYFYTQERPDLSYGYLNRTSSYLGDRRGFTPRFGFAYRPFGDTKTVVRGGYGIFDSSPTIVNIVNNQESVPPAYQVPTFTGNETTPNLTWNGEIGLPPSQFFSGLKFGLLTGPEQHFLNAYTQQWSLTVGHDLSPSTGVTIQYMGSKSTHLENSFDYNYAQPSPLPLQPRLPYPDWGRIFGFSSGAAGNYNALMVTVERRVGHGLTFNVNYTYEKAMTEEGGRILSGFISLVQNSGDLAAENGPTSDDVPQRFVASYVYELPFGPNKRFGRTGGIPGKLIAGWTLSGVTSAQTGLPEYMNIPAGNCNSATEYECRPDRLSNNWLLGGNGVNTPRFSAVYDWPLNPAHAPENPRFGTAGINFLRANGIQDWDMALIKHTRFHERFDVEFRFETYNTWNFPELGTSVADPANVSTFGRTFSTASGTNPREIQFGLKLNW